MKVQDSLSFLSLAGFLPGKSEPAFFLESVSKAFLSRYRCHVSLLCLIEMIRGLVELINSLMGK